MVPEQFRDLKQDGIIGCFPGRVQDDDPVPAGLVREITEFRLVWLYILLSFLFYIPVTVLAGVIPALGMLMLPKTVCYILMLSAFLRFVFGKNTRLE